jgi:hypothetical protein
MLRATALELSQIETELTAKNAEVYALRRRKDEKSEELKQILSAPEHNEVNILSLPDGKEIKIMREYNKPWSLTQNQMKDTIEQYFRERQIPNPDLLIAAINFAVRARNHSTEMKIEFK